MGLSPRCLAMVRSLVNGVHCLAAGEPLLHQADLVDGFGCRRLGLESWCWVVAWAESTSASSSAPPSSTAAFSSGRLLLLLSCPFGGLVSAATLGMPLFEAIVAGNFVGARVGVSCATRDCVEAVCAAAGLDAGHRFVLDRHALDLRA